MLAFWRARVLGQLAQYNNPNLRHLLSGILSPAVEVIKRGEAIVEISK
jgi:hypothetical protein